jgi:hypothetical protein
MNTSMLRFITLIFFAGILAVSCKTKQSSSSTSKTTQSGEYRLVISFISKGSGIDGSKHDAIKKFMDDHPKKVKNEMYRWGREGEVDYCFKLKELSDKDQKAFVEEVKKLAGESDRIFINENSACVHKK